MADNKIHYEITAGKLNNIESYKAFSSGTEYQKGHYLALSFSNPNASKITKVVVTTEDGKTPSKTFTGEDVKDNGEDTNVFNLVWLLDKDLETTPYVGRSVIITYVDALNSNAEIEVVYTLTSGIELLK